MQKLVNDLRRAGQQVGVDLDMHPDDDMGRHISGGLEAAEVFVLVVSGEIPEWTAKVIKAARTLVRSGSIERPNT